MGKFTNGFYSFAEKSCDPEKWQRYFLSFNAKEWLEEDDGILSYIDDNGQLFSLMISYWPDHGIILEYNERKKEPPHENMYSIGDDTLLGVFSELDDLIFPKGCFLSPDVAWLAVEDFLRHPTKPSKRIFWIKDYDINWPEDML